MKLLLFKNFFFFWQTSSYRKKFWNIFFWKKRFSDSVFKVSHEQKWLKQNPFVNQVWIPTFKSRYKHQRYWCQEGVTTNKCKQQSAKIMVVQLSGKNFIHLGVFMEGNWDKSYIDYTVCWQFCCSCCCLDINDSHTSQIEIWVSKTAIV